MVEACWSILLELSPWLLLGMLFAGILHVLVPASLVQQKFRGPWGVIRSVAFGVPLPLCSCGVIPAGIGMKKDGADDGAAVGFLISTPQTGVDSMLVSVSFFGWPFTIFKMLTALILGIVGGLLTNWCGEEEVAADLPITEPSSCCQSNGESRSPPDGRNQWVRCIRHALEVFHSIWFWMLLGIVASAAITVYFPEEWMQRVASLGTWPGMLLVLLISLPLYVCATASVPLAAALVAQGFPVSAALVFLLAGPATNLATVGSIYGRFGWRPLAVYLGVLLIGSLLSGYFFTWLISPTSLAHVGPIGHLHGSTLEIVCSICILGLFLRSAFFDTSSYLVSLYERVVTAMRSQ